MTHLAFLEDTIAFYSVDPVGRRAVNEDTGFCKYRIFDKEGNIKAKCALGRYIPDDKYSSRLEGELIYDMQSNEVFSPEINNLDKNFLHLVQKFHDDNTQSYWYDTGLTEMGKYEANRLRKIAKDLDEKDSK